MSDPLPYSRETLASGDLTAAEELYEAFEWAWQLGSPPRLDAVLANAGNRPSVVEELIKIDLEYRWRRSESTSATDPARGNDPAVAGENAPPDSRMPAADDPLPRRPLLEDYARVYPGLVPSGGFSLELIAEEYRVRQRWGDRPSSETYRERFPHGGDPLAQLLTQVDADLKARSAAAGESAALQLPDGTVMGADSAGDRVRSTARGPAGADEHRYVLTRIHAIGGLGRVWLARDVGFGREIALKELLPEQARHEGLRRRFLEEARITGQLEHPGIVPVYELSYGAGRRQPFYTMRFIHGRTLSQAVSAYHRKRKLGEATVLDLVALLNALVSAANAVAYAHSRGVVHRDLKGSNIVVGDFGETIVLDWGLARLSEERPEEPSAFSPVSLDADADRDRTLQGQLLGTPAYMAPEQARGSVAQIGQRTDVYGLGAILYEILTGQPPFVGGTTHEILRRVVEEPPVEPKSLNREAPPALAAVSLKALAKNTDDRYPSATALAEEIQRWMADQPVAAYPEPIALRWRRWSRQHRSLVTGLTALFFTALLALSVGTVLLGRANRRTREALKKAEANYQQAERNYQIGRDAVDRFFTRVSEEMLLNEPRMEHLRRDLLEIEREYDRKFVEQRQYDAAAALELARSHLRLAAITASIDRAERAIEHALNSLAILSDLVRKHFDDARASGELARAYRVLGNLLRSAGDFAGSSEALRRAIAILGPLVESSPQDASYRGELARCHLSLGTVEMATQKLKEAKESFAYAATILEHLRSDFPSRAIYQEELANCANNQGILAFRAGRPDLAQPFFEQNAAIYQSLVRDHPHPIAYREGLARSLLNLGNLFGATQDPRRAEANYEKARQQFAALAREHPDVLDYQNNAAACENNVGELYQAAGKLKEAQAAQRAAIEIRERLVHAHPNRIDFAVDLGGSLCNLATVEAKRGETAAALGSFERAIAILGPVHSREPRNTVATEYLTSSLAGRAFALTGWGMTAKALADWDLALSLSSGQELVALRLGRALTLARSGQYIEAAASVEELAAAAQSDTRSLVAGARSLAAATAMAATNPKIPPQERQTQAGQLAAQAIAWLRRALDAAGTSTGPLRLEIQQETDFDAIRSRADFQALLADLAFPTDPLAP